MTPNEIATTRDIETLRSDLADMMKAVQCIVDALSQHDAPITSADVAAANGVTEATARGWARLGLVDARQAGGKWIFASTEPPVVPRGAGA